MRRLACSLMISAAALAAGCSEDETYQTGLVVRPSGLSYVEWKYDPAAPDGSRSDLFVADPEAGGVSVAQFNTYYPATSSVTLASRIVFVRSPSLFFPLVLPAPSYATQVATAPIAGTRLFALSPVDGRLHVYGIGEAPYAASVTASNPYSVLGALTLATDLADPQDLVPDDLLANGLAVDVEVLRDDLIVLAIDDLVGGAARLVSVSMTGSPVVAQVVGSTTIAASPRRIAVRSASPRGVWISSASTASVSFVPLLGGEQALGAAQLVAVGGPTSAVVDAAQAGALALRLDRASVVYLDVAGDGFVRAVRPLFSPYTDGLEGPGELRTRSIPVAGALGRVPALLSPLTDFANFELVTAADREADGRAPVVFVAYADGGGAFLVGPTLRWPTSSVRPIAYTRGDETGVRFEGCPDLTPAVCEAVTDVANVTPFECPGAQALVRGGDLTVTYRGAFAVAPRAELTPTASTTPGLVEIATGEGASGFDAVRDGDRVFVALPIQAACATSTAVAGEGVVREVAADRLVVVLDAGALADRAASCGMGTAAGRVEAFAAGPEFVIARGASRERAVATETGGRYSAASDEVIAVAFSVADTATCAVAVAPIRSCATDADCPGAACTASDANLCGGRCAATCAVSAPGCWRAVPERRCPTGALSVASTAGVVNEPEVGFTPDTNRMSVPEDVVFSRVRQAWIISFPGARRIGDARVSPDGTLTLDELK